MRWLPIGALALLLGLAGCKATELTVVNDLPSDTTFTLQGPGDIEPSAMPLARSDSGVLKIQTPACGLPANYTWEAGGRTGTLVVDGDTPGKQVLNLSTGRTGATTIQAGYREPAYREPAYREPGYREPAYREPAYREPADREPAYRDPAERESADVEDRP